MNREIEKKLLVVGGVGGGGQQYIYIISELICKRNK